MKVTRITALRPGLVLALIGFACACAAQSTYPDKPIKLIVPFPPGGGADNLNRWRGKMTADEPGCYVHYLPTHGPNFWDSTAMKNESHAPLRIDGTLYPQWAIGSHDPLPKE